jgi:hypothetical protein
MAMQKIWDCKIGFAVELPDGADAPLRRAIRDAYMELTGKEPDFIFSGWGAELTDAEAAVVSEKIRTEEEYSES